MSDQHACCNMGLCSEAASNKTAYYSEAGEPFYQTGATMKKYGGMYRAVFGEMQTEPCEKPHQAKEAFNRIWWSGK